MNTRPSKNSKTACLSSLAVFTILFLGGLAGPVQAQLPSTPSTPTGAPTPPPPAAQLQQAQAGQGVLFEKNMGQWDAVALFRVHAEGYDAFITKTGFAMVQVQAPARPPATLANPHPVPTGNTTYWATLMRLVGSNAVPLVTTDAELAYHTNYFIGNDPAKWHPNVPNYHQVTLHNVYLGIDLVYHADSAGKLKYDFIVHPGAQVDWIKQKYTGPESITKNVTGALVIETGLGTIHQAAPLTRQANGVTIPNHYTFTNGTVAYAVGAYDSSQDLIIDPLVYSTYLGGSSSDVGSAIAVDGSGNAYVTGSTLSTNYPVTSGAYRITNGGFSDVFVSKLNSAGSSLTYSTYIGGSDDEYTNGIAVDGSGNAYVTGYTLSTNYPVTSGAYRITNGGFIDVFVSKLNSAGSALAYSTYIGGSGDDEGYAIAVDGSGNAYVTGYALSTNYPVTSGAYQTTNAGGYSDVFVSKLNSAGSALAYSTYIGGSGDDEGYAIVVDGSGNAYVAGYTYSMNYPVTSGAYQTAKAGSGDVFVSKLNSAGSALAYSTYIGGSGDDEGYAIAVDGSGNAYVAGYTYSMNYPVTSGAYQTAKAGSGDVFVSKLNSAGSALAYSTYIGGSGDDYGSAIAVDGSGNAYVAGYTYSMNYPVTSGAYQTTNAGDRDVFVSKLNSAGSALAHSTYIGGSSYDRGQAIAVDGSGNAYVTGYTLSTNYPVTSGAYQTTNAAGGYDVFVTKVNPLTPITIMGNPAATSWRNTIPTLSGVSWQAATNGLQNNAQYSIGSTSGGTEVLGWTSMPVQPTSGQTTSWSPSWTPSTLAQGMNYINIKVNDGASNQLQTNGAYTVQYDTGLPGVSGNPQSYSWRNTVTLVGGASFQDAVSGLQNNAEYSVGSTSGDTDVVGWTVLGTQPTSGQTSAWTPSFTPSSLAQGMNYINTRVQDRVGNTLTTNGAYTVQYDNVGDAVTGLAAKTGCGASTIPAGTWQGVNTPRFEWSSASSTSPIAGYSYTLANSAMIPDSTVDTTATCLSPGALADGSWSFEVLAKDTAGNIGSVAGPLTVLVDATPPTLPTVSSSTHSNQSLYYTSTAPTLSWSSSDATSGVAGYYYTAPGTGSCAASLTDGTWTTGTTESFTGLGPFGSYHFCVQGKDNAGNLGPVTSRPVNVNTLPPTIERTTPLDGSSTSSLYLPVTGSYNDFKGGQDPQQKTIVDPLQVKLFVDGADVVAEYRNAPECTPNPATGQVPPTCPVQVSSSSVQYTPPPSKPWSTGIHQLSLDIGDTTVPPVRAATTWSFTEAPTTDSCPNGQQGAMVLGVPVCQPMPCPEGVSASTAGACGITLCPSGLTSPAGPNQVAVVCGNAVDIPCPQGADPNTAGACGITLCPSGVTGPAGANQIVVVCGHAVDNPCPQGADPNTAGACGATVCPSGITSSPEPGQDAVACGIPVQLPCPQGVDPGTLQACSLPPLCPTGTEDICGAGPDVLSPCPDGQTGQTVDEFPVCAILPWTYCATSFGVHVGSLPVCVDLLQSCPTGMAGAVFSNTSLCLSNCPANPASLAVALCIPTLASCNGVGIEVNGFSNQFTCTPNCPAGPSVCVPTLAVLGSCPAGMVGETVNDSPVCMEVAPPRQGTCMDGHRGIWWNGCTDLPGG